MKERKEWKGLRKDVEEERYNEGMDKDEHEDENVKKKGSVEEVLRVGGKRVGRKNKKKRDWTSIKLVTWNVNGLKNKIEELRRVAISKKWDIIMVEETYVKENDKIKMEGFVWFSGGGVKGKGGVGMFVAEYIAQYVGIMKEDRTDMLWVKVEVEGRKKRMIGVVYGPDDKKPKVVKEEFFEELSNRVSEFKNGGWDVVVMGDFNARVGRGGNKDGVIGMYGEEQENCSGKLLIEIAEGYGLKILNGRKEGEVEWTFMGQGKGGMARRSVVDLVVVNNELYKWVRCMGVERELDVGGDGHVPVG